MDPDIPAPSIEHDQQATPLRTNNFRSFRDRTGSPLSSSPNRTPLKNAVSQATTPDTIKSPSPSLHKNARRSSPNLQSERSSSSLSVSRGQTPSRIQLRRVSSNLNPAIPTVNMRPPESSPPRQMTAETVAQDYFQRELEAHAQAQSKTIVIIHDSCYGHRFSRPRTSKAALSTIVERPERIHATLLGASTAYVQLGQRHADGANGPHPNIDVKNVPSPPFILRKTTRSIPLNHAAVTHTHGTRWMEELQIMCDSAESKLTMNGKELQRPIGYGKDEEGNNLPKLHEGDLYLCAESLAALQGCLGGVCDAVDTVFSPSSTTRAFVCIRPPGHHCSSNYPSGFCWLNNVHVGISYAAMNHGLTHVAIIDFDLHHGDGSQTITWDHNRKAQSLPKNAPEYKKTPIGYYSLHDINSYPCEWGDEDKVRNASLCIENAHGQSIWNVHLEPWTSLEHFWQLYETKYRILLDKTKSFLRHHSEQLRASGIQPKAAIFISAGFDASQWEGQGMQRHNVNVPTEFYARFTADIVELASQMEFGVDGRVISVLEGGYSDRALTSGVLSHLCGLSGDVSNATVKDNDFAKLSNGLGVGTLNLESKLSTMFAYDNQWWHETNLEALENRVAGIVAAAPKSVDKNPGTYSSPTQASTARMTDVARERKSISTQIERRMMQERAEPIPPPPVDWVVASYELSRVLIPKDRQTMSCRHEELNAEATKARRDRQSAIGVAVPSEPRMQLRTRGKAPVSEADNVRAASRTSNRRTTIAALSELPDPSMPPQRPRRRSSGASSILSSFQDMKLKDEKPVSMTQADSKLQAAGASNASADLITTKAKMGPPAKKTTSRISSPRKAKATTRPTSTKIPLQDKLNAASNESNKQVGRSNSRSRPSSTGEPVVSDAMDDLTSGMKKVSIKLKMPTQEEHAENQRKLEESQLKKPRVIRKPAIPKVTKSKTSPKPAIASVAQPGIGTEDSNKHAIVPLDNPTTAMHHQDTSDLASSPKMIAFIESQHLEPSRTPFTELSAEVNTMAQTNDPVYHVGQSQQMPDADTVPGNIMIRTKADLPTFNSSSPIPFANQHKAN